MRTENVQEAPMKATKRRSTLSTTTAANEGGGNGYLDEAEKDKHQMGTKNQGQLNVSTVCALFAFLRLAKSSLFIVRWRFTETGVSAVVANLLIVQLNPTLCVFLCPPKFSTRSYG